MKGYTDTGKRRFGAFLQQCLDRKGYTSLESAAIALSTKSDIPLSELDLAILIHAQWQEGRSVFSPIVALIISDILKFPSDSRSLDFNDITRTLKGEIDPFTY